MPTLKDRLAAYFAALPGLLPQHEGKYALVCDSSVEIYTTAQKATEVAMARCNDPARFLVIKIEALTHGP